MITFNHFNFNVLNLDKSLAFYKEALGLRHLTAPLSWYTWVTGKRTSPLN